VAYPPSADFTALANGDASRYDMALADRDAFWATQADRLSWHQRWSRVLDWTDAPVAKPPCYSQPTKLKPWPRFIDPFTVMDVVRKGRRSPHGCRSRQCRVL
jgi:hypothetical protein